MDGGKVLLVTLAKGKIGEDAAHHTLLDARNAPADMPQLLAEATESGETRLREDIFEASVNRCSVGNYMIRWGSSVNRRMDGLHLPVPTTNSAISPLST